MKRLVLLGLVIILAACSADKSKELFETAQFEEKQHNLEHAKQLYQEIVTKYPNSPVAKQAQDRLAEIQKKP